MKALLAMAALALFQTSPARGGLAQPVPIPEDMAAMPQFQVDGVGIGTAGRGNRTGDAGPSYRNALDFSDSALLFGAAQRMYRADGIGSMGFGFLVPETRGASPSPSIHQAFLDYQTERTEWLIGRTDNPAAHLVDFPTIREEDLLLFTNPLDPFSDGSSSEDHRYSNVVSFTLNQGLTYFENIHAQQLADRRASGNGSTAINSYGFAFERPASPGMEALSRIVSYGAGFERQINGTGRGINQLYAGGVLNINESMTDRVDFRLLELLNFGPKIERFQDPQNPHHLMGANQASYNAVAASLRYLRFPFGKPGYQIALTGGYKAFFKVGEAKSWGLALTGVKCLGGGFDLVAQYETQWRGAALADLYQGQARENVIEAGLVFNFSATFNSHLSPRRTLLNTRHEYVPD